MLGTLQQNMVIVTLTCNTAAKHGDCYTNM